MRIAVPGAALGRVTVREDSIAWISVLTAAASRTAASRTAASRTTAARTTAARTAVRGIAIRWTIIPRRAAVRVICATRWAFRLRPCGLGVLRAFLRRRDERQRAEEQAHEHLCPQ